MPESFAHPKASLAAYYTPVPLARMMTTWALRSQSDALLDPSFGGCAFFRAAISRLRQFRCSDPFLQLAGVDIDRDAATFLRRLPGYRPRPSAFKLGRDFFGVAPLEFRNQRFRVIAGNPPYIRHHRLEPDQVELAQSAISEGGYHLPLSAGYWAYFVLHSLRFLADNGRLAMVLPTSVLNADYAAEIRRALRESFGHVTYIVLRERLFEDAEEASVVMLADGYRQQKNSVRIAAASEVPAAARLCSRMRHQRVGRFWPDSVPWRSVLLNPETQRLYRDLLSRKDVRLLREIAALRIGVVTGANRFFVLRPSIVKKLGISERYLAPIVTTAKHLPALEMNSDAFARAVSADTPCELLVVPKGNRSRAVDQYLGSGAGRAARKRYKCAARDVWFMIEDRSTPDAFLSYVNDVQPRIVLNSARILCTNAIHRIWWKKQEKVVDQRLRAVSLLSSLSALGAELVGRSYGGGALKIEPSDAGQIPMALPKLGRQLVVTAFEKAANHLTRLEWRSARAVADNLVLRQGLELKTKQVGQLMAAYKYLSRLRRPLLM